MSHTPAPLCPCGCGLRDPALPPPREAPADVDGWRMTTTGGLPELHLGPRTRLVIGTLAAAGLLAGILSTVAGVPYLEALGWVGIVATLLACLLVVG